MKPKSMIYVMFGALLGAGGVLVAELWPDLPLREFFSPGEPPEAPPGVVGTPQDGYVLPPAPPVSDIVGPLIGPSNVRPEPDRAEPVPGSTTEQTRAAAERQAVRERFDRLNAALRQLAAEPLSLETGSHSAPPAHADERRRILLEALRILETNHRGPEGQCE